MDIAQQRTWLAVKEATDLLVECAVEQSLSRKLHPNCKRLHKMANHCCKCQLPALSDLPQQQTAPRKLDRRSNRRIKCILSGACLQRWCRWRWSCPCLLPSSRGQTENPQRFFFDQGSLPEELLHLFCEELPIGCSQSTKLLAAIGMHCCDKLAGPPKCNIAECSCCKQSIELSNNRNKDRAHILFER
jgi:hypothetical protein